MDKKLVYDACLFLIDERISYFVNELSKIQEGKRVETKSSAGDKYETAREMLKQEEDKLSSSLLIFQKYKQVVSTIDFSKKSPSITVGSLVTTDKGKFFIAEALGKLDVKGEPVFVISTKAPIYQLLYGKKKGEVVQLNNMVYKIFAVD